MSEEKKKIEVITGDGKDLNISPVYNHISSTDKPKSTKKNKKDIIIPHNNK